MQKPTVLTTSALILKALKSQTPCVLYKKGKCRFVLEGGVCGFVHDPTVAPGMIPCAFERPDGSCEIGKTCLYRHQVERMAEDGSEA